MTRRDPRESSELLVPISGCRIWHMSDDRQARGTLGFPLFGLEQDSHSNPQFIGPSPGPPSITRPTQGEDQPSDLKNERSLRRRRSQVTPVTQPQMHCHPTVNCQRCLDWNPGPRLRLSLALT